MKRVFCPVALAFAMLAGWAWGAGPTELEIESHLLFPLIVKDIARIRMAGLDTVGDRPRVADLAVSDEGAWEPGRFQLRFRVFFEATDDLYAQVPLSFFARWAESGRRDGDEDECIYIRVGRKGEKVSVQYEVETERKGGQWIFAKTPYAGKFEWAEDVDWPVRTRGCWEEWGRQMGQSVAFYESERAAKEAVRHR